MNPWYQLLIGWGAMSVIMSGLWVVQNRGKNAAIVDVAWAAGVGTLGVSYALFADGFGPRKIIIAIAIGLWAFRLAFYLFQRTVGQPEDGRYLTLMEEWGDKAQSRLFMFFQVQAFWAVMFAAPIVVAARNATPELGLTDYAGIAIFFLAFLGESIADRQLAGFRNNKDNKGQVCRDGLWSWSRHPNYFFEWLHWFAYVLIGIAAPYGWLTLFGPVIMLTFLLRVTGIPYTEAQALKSRGQAYRDYQNEVSAFVPWPPKKGLQTS